MRHGALFGGPIRRVAPFLDHVGGLGRTMGEPKRILIVEDDADMIDITSAALVYHGFVVMTVRDGALACAAAVQHRPDLILLDLRLPNAPGERIAADLHGDRRCKHIPVVVVTADVAARDAEFPPNVRGVLLKPCDPRKVVETVLAAL